MKKIITLSLIMIGSMLMTNDAYANKCQQQADACYARCDQNWQGETLFDGAGRVICKTGCLFAEFACVIRVWVS